MRLREIRINTRIYAGFGAVIALAAVLAILGVSQLVSVSGQVGRLVKVSDNAARSLLTGSMAQAEQLALDPGGIPTAGSAWPAAGPDRGSPVRRPGVQACPGRSISV